MAPAPAPAPARAPSPAAAPTPAPVPTPTTTTTASAPASPASPPATAAPPLLIQKLSGAARTPTRGSALAAGYDLYAARGAHIAARGRAMVDTDLAVGIPPGTYGRVAPRSGLAAKHAIETGAGVIDADYRGHVRVLLFNHAETGYDVREGDRIAQLVLEKIYTPEIVVVDRLDESVRGAAGFGSTGS